MKIPVVGAELFHAVGRPDRQMHKQTDMTELIVAFRNFANAPQNGVILPFSHTSSWHGSVLATWITVLTMGISYVHFVFLFSENISQLLMKFDVANTIKIVLKNLFCLI
jgi:hypothetical protein